MRIQNRLGQVETVETLLAHERRMNQAANNLANVNTAGFKRDGMTFWEMIFRSHSGRMRVGKASRVVTDHGPGALRQTGNPLDMAIDGDGFFRIQSPRGVRYSRAGQFTRSAAGELVTRDGYPVLGEGGPIALPNGTVGVGLDGRITVDGVEVDRLAVVTFPEMAALEKDGDSLFRVKEGAPGEEAAAAPVVQQGYVEESNVNMIQETTGMIDLFRAFELQQRVIRTIDEVDEQAIQRVGSMTV
ncbi:MAG: flagellar basal-body rod protein FlgF [Thermodesulfobacteriota bacterium]